MAGDPAAPWRRLNIADATRVHDRWANKSGGPDDDELLSAGRVVRNGDGVQYWTVKTRLELLRLLGALQFFNQRCTLWLRGEANRHQHARPSRYRDGSRWDLTRRGLEWIGRNTRRSPLLRDRGPLARVAILQHYGLPTSFVDLTLDLEVALAFAWWRPIQDRLVHPGPEGWPNISVYATPRVTEAVNVLHELDLVVVDLRAELPSHCLRPHVQQAGFVARASCALADLDQTARREVADVADIDVLRIARVHLAGDVARPPWEEPDNVNRLARESSERFFPAGSAYCRHCTDTAEKAAAVGASKDRSDLNGDLLAHKLDCLGESDPIRGLTFPSFYRKRQRAG